MAALAGKAAYGRVTGNVKINGKSDKLLRYKRVMGFVPQVRSLPQCCSIPQVQDLFCGLTGGELLDIHILRIYTRVKPF